MKISIISGSHRKVSQSQKVARFIQQTLEDQNICDETWLFSLAENPLPLWDESIWEGNPDWKKKLDPISSELTSSDGFVVISPEWHGQVPSGLKNFLPGYPTRHRLDRRRAKDIGACPESTRSPHQETSGRRPDRVWVAK